MIKQRLLNLIVMTMCFILVISFLGLGQNSAAAKGKEIIINFPSIWVGKDSKAKVMDELVTKFNEDNKGTIKVVVEEIADYDAYEEKMRTSIAAGSIPDVFISKAGSKIEPFFKSGKLMDLTSYMNEGWKDRFVGNILNTATYSGKILAVPYEFAITPVLYNATLLKDAGYDTFPETYDEFFEMCEKLEANGIIPLSLMTADNAWTAMLWYSQLLHAIGGPDIYEKGFDDPAYVEAAKVLKKMFEYTTSDAVGANAAVAAGHFLSGRTAMLMNGPWFIGRIKSEGSGEFYTNVAVANAPAYKGGMGQKGGEVGFVQALICAGKQKDKDKEVAVVKFLKYLTESDNVKRLSIDSGALFVIKTDMGEGDEMERLQKQMVELSNNAPYVVPHFNMSVKQEVATEFPQALSSMVLGEKSPEQFVETLKEIDER